MPKLVCTVVGHKRVKKGEDFMTRVDLSNPEGLRCSFLVREEERENYPYGAEASFGFAIQQSLPLEAGEGGRDPEKSTRRSRKGNGATESASAAH